MPHRGAIRGMVGSHMTSKATIHVGPFQLVEPIARGGSGVVWAGVHPSGLPVAIKVLRLGAARDPIKLRAITNEVRAAAALDHPSIVTIYDYGIVAEGDEQALEPGSPYIVMERGEHGSLLSEQVPLPWPRLQEILVQLLEALAHAHARGVVHRDIKPANVILSSDGASDLGPRAKLVDFGVAATIAHGPADHTPVMGATPAYMAPEQISGGWREQGPWTDLYGLGCVAWRLATGQRLFAEVRDAAGLAHHHLNVDPPLLKTDRPIPQAFPLWLAQLLRKDPQQRFERAADALRALLRLSGDELTRGIGWREAEHPQRRSRLEGVGLGLSQLKRVALVGREVERDLLWNALEEVSRTRKPKLAVLRGPSGVGKSRLAQWLCETGHELGVASFASAVHHPSPGPGDGLGPMVGRLMRISGLPREDIGNRLAWWLASHGVVDPLEGRALTELVAPSASDHPDHYRFQTPAERYLVLLRLLVRRADERPLIVWLDDAHHSEETLRFLLHATTQEVDAPIFFVATIQEEALGELPAAASLVAQLEGSPGTLIPHIHPLDATERAALIQGELGLEDELAARVEQRTAGNPLFAIQLVSNWVARGNLQAGERGFSLREGASAELPDTMYRVWADRLDDVLAGRGDDETIALELAAVLGGEVDLAEWAASCKAWGEATGMRIEVPFELADELARRRLWRVRSSGETALGWIFAHGMLRESVEWRAKKVLRWAALNRATATALADKPGPPERLARMWERAGEPEQALRPLLDGAREWARRGDMRMAEALLKDRERVAREAGLPVTDYRWGEGWIQLATVLREQGRLDDALTYANRVARGIGEGWSRLHARAAYERGATRLWQGQLAEAEKELAQARLMALREGEVLLAVRAEEGIARVLYDQGRRKAALPRFSEALKHYDALGEHARAARTRMIVAHGLMRAELYEEAEAELMLAQGLLERHGARFWLAEAQLFAGELARARGLLGQAEANYERARELQTQIGSGNMTITEINLALVKIQRARFAEARAILERCLADAEQSKRQRLMGSLTLFLATCAVGLHDYEAFDRYIAEASSHLEAGYAEEDNAIMARLAGDLLRSGGHRERAKAAYEVCRSQLERLSRDKELAEVEAMLERL